jgi:protein-tyrosine phosphatase
MKKILFVCLGNICRSPQAKAIFNYKMQEKGLNHLFTGDACGTSNYHIGDAPDHRTIRNSIKNDVPISHAARQLTNEDLIDFDLILAMDQSNYQNIFRLSMAEGNKHKIKLLRDYDPHEQGDVPDPYYGNEMDFQEVFDILNRSIENLIENISPESR